MGKNKKSNFSPKSGNIIIGNRDLNKPSKPLSKKDKELQERYNRMRNEGKLG